MCLLTVTITEGWASHLSDKQNHTTFQNQNNANSPVWEEETGAVNHVSFITSQSFYPKQTEAVLFNRWSGDWGSDSINTWQQVQQAAEMKFLDKVKGCSVGQNLQ
jgi:hypothetical protein